MARDYFSAIAKACWPLWLVACLAHFPIFLAAGGYHWDGAFMQHLINAGQFDTIERWLIDSGLLPHSYLYLALASTGKFFPLWAHILSLGGLVAAAMAAQRIMEQTFHLSRGAAQFVACIMISWPFMHMIMIETMVAQLLLMACFFCGWSLWLECRLPVRIAAMLLILVSFYHGLYILVHLALLAAVCSAQSLKPADIKASLRQHGWLLPLPLIFYVVKSFSTPLTGLFAEIDYNVPLVLRGSMPFTDAVMEMIRLTWINVLASLGHPVIVALHVISRWPLLIVLALMILVFRPSRLFSLGDSLAPRRGWLMLSGATLLLAVTFAHGAVGHYPHIQNPLARHASHAGIGFGLMALAVIYFLPRIVAAFRTALAWLLVAAFVTSCLFMHSLWITNEAKDVAVFHELNKHPTLSQVQFFRYQDNGLLTGLGWFNDTGEQSVMFKILFNRPNILVLRETPKDLAGWQVKTQETIDYWLKTGWSGFDAYFAKPTPDSCLAYIATEVKTTEPDTTVALQYLYYRWFKPTELNDWLEKLVHVQFAVVRPLQQNQPCL